MKSQPSALSLLLTMFLCGAAGLGSQETESNPAQAFPAVESISLIEHSEGVELEIQASGALIWSLRDPGGGELIVRLRGCRPGPEQPVLRPAEGLVESVTVSGLGSTEAPETWVSVRTREAVKYRVAVGAASVTVLLIPRQPPLESPVAEAPEPVAPPAPAPPAPPVAQPPVEDAGGAGNAPVREAPAPPDAASEMVAESPIEPSAGAGPEPLAATPIEPPSLLFEAPPEVADPLDAALPPPSIDKAPGTVAGRAGEYRIGAGDVLAIDVFGLDEMDRKVRVQRDGMISLPLLDAFPVDGLELEGAEQRIADMLRERQLVRDPQVSIFVEELVSRGVNVQGAVVRPGIYQLIGSKTVLEVIGEAGGVREDSGTRILVLRMVKGQEQKMDLDLERLIDGADPSLNVQLLPDDVVMVPFSRQLTVYVTGAVEQPGPVTYQSGDGITVLQAIIAAGGPTPRANLKNVHLLRKIPGGGQEQIKVNLKKIQSGRMDDLLLERNDTVVVGEWFF